VRKLQQSTVEVGQLRQEELAPWIWNVRARVLMAKHSSTTAGEKRLRLRSAAELLTLLTASTPAPALLFAISELLCLHPSALALHASPAASSSEAAAAGESDGAEAEDDVQLHVWLFAQAVWLRADIWRQGMDLEAQQQERGGRGPCMRIEEQQAMESHLREDMSGYMPRCIFRPLCLRRWRRFSTRRHRSSRPMSRGGAVRV